MDDGIAAQALPFFLFRGAGVSLYAVITLPCQLDADLSVLDLPDTPGSLGGRFTTVE